MGFLLLPNNCIILRSHPFGGTGDGDISLGFIGLMMTMGGVYWLIHLANTEKKK
jgi:hypothetical protein